MLPSGEIPMPYSTTLVKSNRFLAINTVFLTLEFRARYKLKGLEIAKGSIMFHPKSHPFVVSFIDVDY
jgi:hypothetical protein